MRIFDIETNAVDFNNPRYIEEEIEVCHCIVIHDTDSGSTMRCNDQHDGNPSIAWGLDILMDAPEIGGHNISRFDIPALQVLYPGFRPKGRICDTIVASELVWGKNLRWIDKRKREQGAYDLGKLTGLHSLRAWGMRLGDYKDDYVSRLFDGDAYKAFAEWNPALEDYCEQDVHVNVTLYKMLLKKGILEKDCVWQDSQVAYIIGRQERNGVGFDVTGATNLTVELTAKREELRQQLVDKFGTLYLKKGELIPKRDNGPMGYTKGAPLTKVELHDFNPASHQHIYLKLSRVYGWKPKEYTDKGHPQVTDAIIKSLKYPEAPLLAEYLTVQKRLGQVSEGKEAWLQVERNGRVHGKVNVNGTRTGRMSHNRPNVSAVPRVGSPYGAECRALFTPRPGWVFVGADASGIELRMLAHYLGRFDDGAFARDVLEGDPHSTQAEVLGCSRNGSKTFRYAYLYGAGNEKLGRILFDDAKLHDNSGLLSLCGTASPRALQKAGKLARERVEQATAGLTALRRDLKSAVNRGWALGLDGRRLYGLSEHNSLNTLLQSAGGVVMKRALIMFDAALRNNYTPGVDYEFCINAHDEWQVECRPEIAFDVGEQAVGAIKAAGEYFNLRCPLDGEYKIGATWAETH